MGWGLWTTSHARERVPARSRRALLAGVVVMATIAATFAPAGAAKPGGGGTTTTSKPSVEDYAQCQNDKPPSTRTNCVKWGNGILNTSNSHYAENQVTPQRLLIKIPKGAATQHSVRIRYMTLKGSANAHAYDYLATWNHTQTTADRCQGLGTKCPNGVASTFDMVSDSDADGHVPPAGPGISTLTSDHELPQADRKWVLYGGTLTGATNPTHSGDPNDPGTDYATVSVTFTVPNTTADRYVQLLFGGHLSASDGPTGWGLGFGSSNISGGPYHAILDALNGESVGSRDNQIMASAILAGSPAFTISKSANPTTASPGQNVTYTVTVTNTGTASGATTFVDDYDDRITILTVPTGCQDDTPNGKMTCTTSTIAPQGSQAFVYTAAMPSTFTGTPGPGCNTGQFPVRNTATLANGMNASALVCVNASPTFTVSKSANPTTAEPGDQVTYTVTVTNGGSAPGSTTFTDDHDDRITDISAVTSSPAGGGCSPTTVNGNKLLDCQTSTIDPGQSQTFTYTANMPASFTTTPGGHGCTATGPEQHPVRNVVVLANGNDADAVVCVNAAPKFDVTKTAETNSAKPGDEVDFTLRVDNIGTASGVAVATDSYDPRVTITSVPQGCSNDAATHTLTCTTGTLAPLTGTQSFTYTARMPDTFSGASGTAPCQTGEFPVVNSVVVTGGDSDTETVCVEARPDLSLVKAGPEGVDIVQNGDEITYTLTYSNSGKASASGVQIVEPIPTGTEFVGCSDGCTTNGPPITSATWQIGTVPAGASDSVMFTVRVIATDSCTICNTARISSPDFDGGATKNSNEVCLDAVTLPNPGGANASGEAVAAHVQVITPVPVDTGAISPVSSEQVGVGSNGPNSDEVLATSPDIDDLLIANVLRTSSTSTVTATPPQSGATSTAGVAHVCLLPREVLGNTVCTIEADTVRAVASTTTSGTNATWSSAGSTIQNLKVNGVLTPVDLNQTTTIPLDPTLFGADSYVKINERTAHVDQPAEGQLSGGRYAAELTVTMIHAKVTGLPGGVLPIAAEIIVSQATAKSDFPQLRLCDATATRSVSGHAFAAQLSTLPNLPLIKVLQGYVELAPTGGDESQQLVQVVLADGTVLSAKAADTATGGDFVNGSHSGSYAEVVGDSALPTAEPVCILPNPEGGACVISAMVIHTDAHSHSPNAPVGATSSSTGTTTIVGLAINGNAVPAPGPEVNQLIELPGLGFLILNEQICDGGGTPVNGACTGADSSGITVRALRLVVTVPIPNVVAGAELIVAESHADSRFDV